MEKPSRFRSATRIALVPIALASLVLMITIFRSYVSASPTILSNSSTIFQLQGENSPTVVGTSTTSTATQESHQRKSFYAAGRFWVWYSDGTNLVYRSSTDGTIWSTETSVGACSAGNQASVFFDGTYVHYVRYAPYVSCYRQGAPNADGTITWSTAEQIVYSGTSADYFNFPMIAVDSGGYAWIGARHYDGTNYRPRVLKNANNDGTWSMAGGFPYTLSTTSSTAWRVSIVPLTNQRVYAIYSRDTVAGLGMLWDGSSWGAEETAISDAEYGYGHSAVAEGDNVHLVFLHDVLVTGIRYNKRTYGVGWGAEEVVQADAASYMTPALSIDPSSGDLYCFWAGSPTANYIYYKKRTSSGWDISPTVLATRQATQSLTTGGDLDENFYGTIWKSQSFISTADDNLWRVDIYSKRAAGTASVPITVKIYNADAENKPTGTPLYTGTIPSFTSTSYAWRTHTLTTPLRVAANQRYCLVIGAPSGTATEYYHWQVDSTSPPYTSGNWAYSTNDEATWTADLTKDGLFIVRFDSTLPGNDRLTSFYKAYNNRIGLVYTRRDTSPYQVAFDYLMVVLPPGKPVLTSPENATPTSDNTPTFTWQVGSKADNHRILVDNDGDLLSPVDNVLLGATDNTWTKPDPGYVDGVYYWKAVAINAAGENSSNIWNFTIDTVPPSKPVLVSPENNRLDNVLAKTFTWTRPEPNVTYHIQIDDESGFSPSYVHENTAVGENTYNYTFSTGGTYHWRVRAKDQANNWSPWSDNFKLVIDVMAPSAPTLLEPADEAVVNDNTPTFRWSAVSDPSAPVTYFMQVDNDSNFSSPEINVSELLGNTYTPAAALVDENYSWRVRARDNAGNWGAWSSTWTLLIDTIVDTSLLLEPSNGAMINDNIPTFRWTIVSDNSPPVTYDMMVDNDSNFTSPEINVSGLSDNTCTPTSELADENYLWRVRARDDLGNIGTWSSIWTFMLDTVPSEAPTLLIPVDGTITDDNTPTFLCSTVNDTSKSGTGEASGVRYYEFWVDNDPDFSSPEILENFTISTRTPSTELVGENYSWRVRAWDGAGNVSSFSSVWTFVIENFSISTNPESLEIMRGSEGAVRLSIIKDYGPSENAALSGSWVGDTPDDVTASFAPVENKMPFEGTLTFDTRPSASPGTFTYRVKATSDSGMDRTVDVEVTIVSTIFTVGSYPRVLELMRGDTATSTVSVDYLLGKKETVFLNGSWIGATPTGVVASFSLQNGLPPFRSTLRFTTGNNATAGSFTYRVMGNGGGLTRTDDITVDITTNLTLTLNTDKTSYEKGQKIRISGTAKDPKENPVENGEATITLRSGKWADQLVTRITDGTYAENYYITFDKPEGDWSISASAVDNRGNLGQSSENVIVSVSIPAAWKYYTITFLSPPPNTVCSRGEEIAVTIQITEGAEKISGADVYLATPSGEIITLAEGSPGIYSLVYVIRWDDPAGEWTMSVLGEKTVQGTYKAGTGSTSLDIAPADLKLELLEPSQRTFEVGEEVNVKVRVSYPDGSPVDGAIVIADSSNGENLALLNEGEGTYRGTYSVSSMDLGAWGLTVTAVDAYGNSGTSSAVTLRVEELSPLSYPIRYWWITIPVVLACALVPIPTVVKKLRIRKLNLIKSEIRATEKLRRELPNRYFVKGAISRDIYDSLMHQSMEKLMKLKKDARGLQGKLEKGK